jgi:hypothetical protein
MLYRLGSALLLIGLVALVVFALTQSISQGDFRLLLAAAATAAAGLFLHRRGTPAGPPGPRRFRAIRRMLGDQEDADDSID